MRARTLTRDAYRHMVPDGAKHTQIPGLPAEYYTWENDLGVPVGIGFGGKRSAPDFHYRFANETARKGHIENWLNNLRTRAAETEARRAERSKPHTLKVGDILDSGRLPGAMLLASAPTSP